jgi:hypothetical protein
MVRSTRSPTHTGATVYFTGHSRLRTLLKPWNIIILDKLTVAWSVNTRTFVVFHGTRRFINLSTRALKDIISQINPTHISKVLALRSTLLFFIVCTSQIFSYQGYWTTICIHLSSLPRVLHAPLKLVLHLVILILLSQSMLRVTGFIQIYYAFWVTGPPLWSSGQSSWLQIQRSGLDSRRY